MNDVIIKDNLTYNYDILFSTFRVSILKYFIEYLIKNISKQQLCFVFKFSSSYAKPDCAYGKIATIQMQIPNSINYCSVSLEHALNDYIISTFEKYTIGDKTVLWYASIKYYEYAKNDECEEEHCVERIFIDNLNVHKRELRQNEANNESSNTNDIV